MALFLTEKEVSGLLSMPLALEAVEEGFRLQAEGRAANSPRSRIRLPAGHFNFMSAASDGLGVMGHKAYAAVRGHPIRFYMHLCSSETGELLSVMEAGRLGQVRTGAASGVATKYMAREDASTVGIIGAGFQARSQLEAVHAVRPVSRARVFSRTPERRERFAERMSARLGIEVTAAESAEECVSGSDVVITITSSSRPVLEGGWLSPGAHVNAAGANHWMRRELDGSAVGRCDVIATDDVEQAKLECGDLLYPVERGTVRWEQVRNLSDVVAGRTPGRRSGDDITLFESQGLALQDIAVGARIYRLALERGVGAEVAF